MAELELESIGFTIDFIHLTTKQYSLLNEAYNAETTCAQASTFIIETNKLFIMMKCRMHGEWCQTCEQKKTWENRFF